MVDQFDHSQFDLLHQPIIPGFNQICTKFHQVLFAHLPGSLPFIETDSGLAQADLLHLYSGLFKLLPDHPEATLADHVFNIDGVFYSNSNSIIANINSHTETTEIENYEM